MDILKDVVTITPSEQVEAKLKERLDTINSELDGRQRPGPSLIQSSERFTTVGYHGSDRAAVVA